MELSLAHAEMVAVSLAQSAIGNWNLGSTGDAQLVTSCEPCAMCFGAVPWSGVSSIIWGASKEDAEERGFDEGDKPVTGWNPSSGGASAPGRRAPRRGEGGAEALRPAGWSHHLSSREALNRKEIHGLKIALAQMIPDWLNREGTLARIEEQIEEAAARVRSWSYLVKRLLPGYPFWPELTGGAVFESDVQKDIFAHYAANAVDIEGGDLDSLCRRAGELGIAVYLGPLKRSRTVAVSACTPRWSTSPRTGGSAQRIAS